MNAFWNATKFQLNRKIPSRFRFKVHNPKKHLRDFVSGHSQAREDSIKYCGRSWKVCELRLKTTLDLQKLW